MDELDLKFREITACQAAEDLVVTHEESMETAIPEYCPDLARIVDTEGRIRIREKALSDGKLTISGSIRVSVLYTSEESPGLRSLSLTLPFSCKVDDKRDCGMIAVDSRLLLLEVKMLGSRKLYIRALPEFRAHGWRKVRKQICSGADGSEGLQVLRQQALLPLMTDVWERECSIAQEVPDQNGTDDAPDLLMDQVFLRVNSCQQFGSKLVIKGDASLSMLCRGDTLESKQITLPFSQIIDGEDLPEDGVFCCMPQVMEYEVHPVRTENGSGFGVTIRMGLLIQTYQQYPVEYVSDLYSTRNEIQTRRENVSLPTSQQPEELRRDTAQRLEGAGAFVYLTDADCTQGELATTDGDHPVLRTTVHMKILYLDESGTPVIAERSAEVSGELGQIPTAFRTSVEPETWQRVGSGYEVRVPVTFRLQHTGEDDLTAVVSAQVIGKIDRTATPSLILRRKGAGETLWDLAKQCRTEEQAILDANGLTQAGDISDQLLLIPKVR